MTSNDTIPTATLLDHRGNPTLSTTLLADPSTTSEPEPSETTTPGPGPLHPASETHWGRNVGLAFGAFFLLLTVAAAAVAVPHLSDGTGDHTDHPRAFDELESEYSFGIGSLTVDLRDVDFPAGVHTVAIDHGIGNAEVWLPTDVNYEIRGDLDVGRIELPGEDESGFGNTVTASADVDSDVTVVLDLEAQIGHARVRRG